MNKSLKDQLGEVFVKQLDIIQEPVLKRTDFDYNASNTVNPSKHAPKSDEGLKRK